MIKIKTTVTKGAAYMVVAQMIAIISAYIIHFSLGRYLGPEMYGIYGIIMALISMLTLILTSGLPQAVSKYIAEDSKKAYSIIKRTAKVQFMFSMVLFAIFFFGAKLIANLLNDKSLVGYIMLAAFVIPLKAMVCLYTSYLNGKHYFKRSALLLNLYAIYRIIFILVLAYFFYVRGALFGIIISSAISLVLVLISIREKDDKYDFDIKKVIRFAIPVSMFTVLLTFLLSLDLYMVKSLLGSNELAGYYTSAAVISQMPYQLFSVLSFVLLPAISHSVANKLFIRTKMLINESMRYILILLVPMVLLISAMSKEIVSVIYSSKYIAAAEPLSILTFGLGFFILFFILTTMINASGKPKLSLGILLLVIPLNFILNFIFIKSYGLKGAAISTTIASFVAMVIASAYIYKKFKTVIPFKSLVKILMAGSIIYYIALNVSLSKYLVIVEGGVLFVVYIGILLLFKEIKKADIIRFKSLNPFKKSV